MQKWAMMTVLAGLCVIGCSCDEEPVACVPPPEPLPPMQQLSAELQALDRVGDTNGLTARLEAALTDATFADERGTILAWLLGYELRVGQVDAAVARFGALVGAEPATALPLVDMIPRYYRAQGNETGIVSWCEGILATPGAESLAPSAWRWLVPSLARQDRYGDIQAHLPAVLAFGEDQSCSLLEGTFRQGLGAKAYDELAALLDAVAPKAEPGGRLAMLVALTRADVMLSQAHLDEAERFLLARAETLSDGDLAARLERLVRAADAGGQTQQVERVVAAVLDGMPEKTATRDRVGRLWVGQAIDAKAPAIFLARMGKALDAGLTLARVASAYEDGFYLVMTSGDTVLRDACTALGVRILGQGELSDCERESLLMRQLDSAFYRNDFKAAVTVLKGGIPNHDEAWHTDLLGKVSAHLALQEGRKADAIDLFREHMARIEQWTEPVRNPENGNMMIKEAVMGFNEKRIGDIYASMDGHADDAKAAYARAREWYGKALELFKADSPEHAEAQRELSAVPEG